MVKVTLIPQRVEYKNIHPEIWSSQDELMGYKNDFLLELEEWGKVNHASHLSLEERLKLYFNSLNEELDENREALSSAHSYPNIDSNIDNEERLICTP